MEKFIWLALAGGAGALSRYGLGGFVHRFTIGAFPAGTFVVNLLGSFLFGLIWGLFDQRIALSPQVRLAVLTGFMGAFTTFSTFMFESATLLRDGQWWYAALNLIGQNVIGIALMFTGLAIARLLP